MKSSGSGAEFAPASCEHEAQFRLDEGMVFVGEADTAIELRIAAELLFDSWHADEDEPDIRAVVAVPQVFQRVSAEAFRLVDDDQFDVLNPHSRRSREFADLTGC